LGDAAYLTVLLIIFPLALLQGASHTAIGQLGFVFLATEMCACCARAMCAPAVWAPSCV